MAITAEQFVEYRNESGLTQTEMGERLGGYALRTVQSWEKGERAVPFAVEVVINSGWQPIKTAPRDGRWILAWGPSGERKSPPAVLKWMERDWFQWIGDEKVPVTLKGWVDAHGDVPAEGGWTYWLPLPATPQA